MNDHYHKDKREKLILQIMNRLRNCLPHSCSAVVWCLTRLPSQSCLSLATVYAAARSTFTKTKLIIIAHALVSTIWQSCGTSDINCIMRINICDDKTTRELRTKIFSTLKIYALFNNSIYLLLIYTFIF